MFDTIFGLPLHPLVVHAVVVFLPLGAAAVLVAAVWPKFRRWAGPLPLIVAVAGTALVPVATNSGQFLKTAIGADQNPAVQQHASLGDLMLWWGIGLVVAAALVYWLHRQTRPASSSGQTPKQAVVIAIIAVAAVAGIGTLVHVVRVGDSGSRAAWGSVTEAAE